MLKNISKKCFLVLLQNDKRKYIRVKLHATAVEFVSRLHTIFLLKRCPDSVNKTTLLLHFEVTCLSAILDNLMMKMNASYFLLVTKATCIPNTSQTSTVHVKIYNIENKLGHIAHVINSSNQ